MSGLSWLRVTPWVATALTDVVRPLFRVLPGLA